jgi:hypothetical protein
MMWNRFMSSPYAHLVTAVAVTLGLVTVLLTAQPKKTGFAEADSSARNAPSSVVVPTTLASESNSRMDDAASGLGSSQDHQTTGKSP